MWCSRSYSTAITMRTPEDRRAHLRHRVEYWSERLKAAPRIVRIQRMTRKWGSCSMTGIVTLAEDLADQETSFQDFVIAHELLHLRVPNHGKVFKTLMSVHVPDWREQEVRRLSAQALAATHR
jgi:predicted metal-dependent hydrolase